MDFADYYKKITEMIKKNKAVLAILTTIICVIGPVYFGILSYFYELGKISVYDLSRVVVAENISAIHVFGVSSICVVVVVLSNSVLFCTRKVRLYRCVCYVCEIIFFYIILVVYYYIDIEDYFENELNRSPSYYILLAVSLALLVFMINIPFFMYKDYKHNKKNKKKRIVFQAYGLIILSILFISLFYYIGRANENNREFYRIVFLSEKPAVFEDEELNLVDGNSRWAILYETKENYILGLVTSKDGKYHIQSRILLTKNKRDLITYGYIELSKR